MFHPSSWANNCHSGLKPKEAMVHLDERTVLGTARAKEALPSQTGKSAPRLKTPRPATRVELAMNHPAVIGVESVHTLGGIRSASKIP